jgi:hypothetical protein
VGMAACHFRWVTCRRKNVHSKYELYLLFELTRNAILKRRSWQCVGLCLPFTQFLKWRAYTDAYSLLAPDVSLRKLLRNYGSLCRVVNWLTTWEGVKWTLGVWKFNLRRSQVRKMGRIHLN